MGALIIKIFMSIMEFLGRIFIFNRNLPQGYDKTPDVPYADKGRRLDIFRPTGNKEKLPVLIYIHGGGWTTGSKLTGTRQCVTLCLEGYLVINVKYRLGPKYVHPAPLVDIGLVLKWLNEHKEGLKADTDSIFFGGSSAGGHLSCMASCIATNPSFKEQLGIEFPIEGSQVSGTILICGGYNMETIVDSGFRMIKTMVKSYCGTRKPAESPLREEISPIHHITEDFPPAFITVGERDKLFGQSVELIELLDKKGLEYDKMLFSREVRAAKHAFLHRYYRDCSKKTYKAIIEFMNKHSKAGE